MASAENDAIDYITGLISSYSATFPLIVVDIIDTYPETGDYCIVDIPEESGLDVSAEGLQSYDGTIDVEVGVIFAAAGATDALKVRDARDKIAGLRKHILDTGNAESQVIQSCTTIAPTILSQTEVRRGEFASVLTFTLYAQP